MNEHTRAIRRSLYVRNWISWTRIAQLGDGEGGWICAPGEFGECYEQVGNREVAVEAGEEWDCLKGFATFAKP